jgi:hypothetical protein
MGIRLLSGRSITPEDRRGGTLVAVLSQPLAVRLFPDGDAIGRQVSLSLDNNAQQSLTVVGITADVVTSQMGSPRPQLWVPLAQHPSTRVMVIARAANARESAQSIFQQALPELDRNLVQAGFVTGDQLIKDSMWDLFTHSAVAGACAAIALVLTALGVFGVVGFMVATRTREIGVRIALGASRLRVLGMVLKDTVTLVVPGVIVGLIPAAFLIRMEETAISAPRRQGGADRCDEVGLNGPKTGRGLADSLRARGRATGPRTGCGLASLAAIPSCWRFRRRL